MLYMSKEPQPVTQKQHTELPSGFSKDGFFAHAWTESPLLARFHPKWLCIRGLSYIFLLLQGKDVSEVITWWGVQLSDSLSNFWNPHPWKSYKCTIKAHHTEAALQIATCSRQTVIYYAWWVGWKADFIYFCHLYVLSAGTRAKELKIGEPVKYLGHVFKAVLLCSNPLLFFLFQSRTLSDLPQSHLVTLGQAETVCPQTTWCLRC